MGQFGLLAIPVLLVMMLLSGGTTPLESMPVWLQYLMKVVSPTPHFVIFSQDVLYGFLHRLAADLGDGGHWRCLFRFRFAPLPQRHLRRLNVRLGAQRQSASRRRSIDRSSGI